MTFPINGDCPSHHGDGNHPTPAIWSNGGNDTLPDFEGVVPQELLCLLKWHYSL
jgi:hypothetical protein